MCVCVCACLVRLAPWVLWDRCPSGLGSPCSIRDEEANLALGPAGAPVAASLCGLSWCRSSGSHAENLSLGFACHPWPPVRRTCGAPGNRTPTRGAVGDPVPDPLAFPEASIRAGPSAQSKQGTAQERRAGANPALASSASLCPPPPDRGTVGFTFPPILSHSPLSVASVSLHNLIRSKSTPRVSRCRPQTMGVFCPPPRCATTVLRSRTHTHTLFYHSWTDLNASVQIAPLQVLVPHRHRHGHALGPAVLF